VEASVTTTRRMAILGALMLITCTAGFIAERFTGSGYWWLAFLPVLAYSVILRLTRRSHDGEPS
jgi:hypothetical protein